MGLPNIWILWYVYCLTKHNITDKTSLRFVWCALYTNIYFDNCLPIGNIEKDILIDNEPILKCFQRLK